MVNTALSIASPSTTMTFTHSFIQSGYFYSASSSPLLFRGVPNTSCILCWSFMPERNRQLQLKDLPKVLTWRPEQDSNPWPSDERRRIYQWATTPYKDLSWSVQCIIQRCTTFLGQGPQRIIFSAIEGRRQNYELNFRKSSINYDFFYLTSLLLTVGWYCWNQSSVGL